MANANPRKLQRRDVVELPANDYFLPARVWRRIDENHVQVIDDGLHISIYHEDDLKLSDYTGRWKWNHEPGNSYGNPTRWIPMTSLKELKKRAREYHPHFGGSSSRGKKWSRSERRSALADRTVTTAEISSAN